MTFNIATIIWQVLKSLRNFSKRSYTSTQRHKVTKDVKNTVKSLIDDFSQSHVNLFRSERSETERQSEDLESQRCIKPTVSYQRTCCGGHRVCVCIHTIEEKKEEHETSRDDGISQQLSKGDQTKMHDSMEFKKSE